LPRKKSTTNTTNNIATNSASTALSPTSQQSQQYMEFSENYAVEFAKSMSTPMYNTYFNPMIMNQGLKNINMNPIFPDRDQVEKMISDPKNNEQALRELAQRLYHSQMNFKRLVHYFASIPTFDYQVLPVNASEDDIKSAKFLKEYNKVLDFFDNFDHRKEFGKILIGMMLEDAKFVFLRNSEAGLTLQEMPSDYCLVDSWSQYGYLYCFNLLYFLNSYVDINAFDPIFKKWFKSAMEWKNDPQYVPNPGFKTELRNGRWFYWQEINPSQGWVFKFHNHSAGLTPPFMSLFLDSIEIDNFKRLQKTKTELENYKMIVGTVPLNKNNKSGNKPDDYSISPETLGKFMQTANALLPEGVRLSALPLENLMSVSFENAETKQDVVGTALKNFFAQSGADRSIFGGIDRPNMAIIGPSLKIDEVFITRLYEQFETFCNFQINKNSGKMRWKWKVKFEGTIFDVDERRENALTMAQNGVILPSLASSQGLNLREFTTSLNLMKVMNLTADGLLNSPLITSHTSSNSQSGVGAPVKKRKELKDGGAESRDYEPVDD